MNNRIIHLVAVLLLLLLAAPTHAQQKLKFSVASFEADPFDLTAKEGNKRDGNGELYAIIKVRSNNPDDDLKAFMFNFGYLNHKAESHDDELWVYVQRDAKTVTISRAGYTTINRYDLQTTIEAGKVYNMLLSVKAAPVRMQMVLFQTTPADSKAVIIIQGSQPNAPETMLGTVDASGQIAKNLEMGTYTYKVMSENYYPSDGIFTLSDPSQVHQENVTLRPQFSVITLNVPSEADIYVNGELKGRRTWQGRLNAGTYQVECRQTNHRPATQSISVEEGKPQTFTLQAPTPITGTLSVLSQPLGATITIDGKDYGTTPRNIMDLLIGSHQLKLSKTGYSDEKQTVTVKENDMTEVNVALKAAPKGSYEDDLDDLLVSSDAEKTFTVKGNGKTVTFKMRLVEAGTFEMGKDAGGNDETPVHSVTLTKDYYMGETEVTQALWYAVMGQSPTSGYRNLWNSSAKQGDNYPAYYISYEDCQQFLTKLNQMTGQKFRFPTEAEWEFAAKGGTKSNGYTYAGSNTIGDVAWYEENSYDLGSSNANYGTHAVKTKQPNELGLYDMSGNVQEWCYDWYGSYSIFAKTTNPTGPTTGSNRVARGGGWLSSDTYCRCAKRNSNSPSFQGYYIGLRLAL